MEDSHRTNIKLGEPALDSSDGAAHAKRAPLDMASTKTFRLKELCRSESSNTQRLKQQSDRTYIL